MSLYSTTVDVAALDSFYNSHTSEDDDTDFDTHLSVANSPPHKRYLYPQKVFVDQLRPEEIRWFYRPVGSKNKWVPFIGYDSLRIECRYRALAIDTNGDVDADERILVMGGMYEVDVVNKKCYPVYWSGDVSEIIRGLWFIDWQPLEEIYASRIEAEHLFRFKGQRLEDFSTIPSKGPKPVIHNVQFQNFHVDWNATNEVYMFSESTSSKLMRRVGHSFGWQKSGNRLCRGYCDEAQMDDKPPDITHLVFVIHGIGQMMESGSIVRCCNELRDHVKSVQHKLFPDLSANNHRVEFIPVEWRSGLKLDGDTVESITPHKMKGVRSILNSSAMDILYYTSPLYRLEITQSLQTELVRLYCMFCTRHPYFEANGGKVSIAAHSLGSVITYDIITDWNPIQLYDQFITSIIFKDREEAANSAKNSDLVKELTKAVERVMELEAELKRAKEKQDTVQGHGLPFQLANLFCLGSPLAVFLALRGMRPQGTGSHEHLMPMSKCLRIFNIYHPSDPVAYRLEPLVLKHYSTIKPLPIHYHNAHKHVPYTLIPRRAYAAFKGFTEDGVQRPQREDTQMANGKEGGSSENLASETSAPDKMDSKTKSFSFSKWLSNHRKSKQEDLLSAELKMLQSMEREAQLLQGAMHYPEPKDIDKTGKPAQSSNAQPKTPELEYRLDYQLRERSMENSYLALLTSHTSYWNNRDVALFILVHLYPQLQGDSSLT